MLDADYRSVWWAVVGLLVLGIAACSYTPPGTPKPGSEVGGTGGLSFTHDQLNDSRHLLTVTAAPGLLETEGSIEQRILIFANRFAAEQCDEFNFLDDPNQDQRVAAGFMRRTKSFSFRCE